MNKIGILIGVNDRDEWPHSGRKRSFWNDQTRVAFEAYTSIEPENAMRIQGLYAALTTKNITEAERFYTILFGRAPDDRPLQGLIQWRDVAGANVQIFQDEKRAGCGRCTIVVPQMSVARQTLAKAGLSLRDEREGDFGKIAQLDDPDGNLITLAEPPAIQTR